MSNAQINDPMRLEYERLAQEREELFQERLRLFGLKPTVYVRNLDPTTTEAELKQWFQQSGPIKDVRLQLDANGASNCTAFIEFYYINSCDDACKRFNEQYRDKSSSQPLQVQLEKKFQIANQAYKAQGYRISSNGATHTGGQGYDGQSKTASQRSTNSTYSSQSYSQSGQFAQPQYRSSSSNLNTGAHGGYQNQHSQNGQQNQNNAGIIVAANGDTNAIYIANLRPDVTVEQLKTVFGEFGNILDLKIIPDKGFGFLTFAEIASAQLAIGLHGQQNNSISKRNTTLIVQFKGQTQPKRTGA